MSKLTPFEIMIRDKLIPEIEQNFSKEKFKLGVSPDPIITFSAKHPSVGDLSIYDDGDEITIEIGNITHGHFDSLDADLAQDEMESEIIGRVIGFLNSMFADKFLLFKSQGGGSGGWQHLDFIDKSFKRQENTEYFVWSGLLNDNDFEQRLL